MTTIHNSNFKYTNTQSQKSFSKNENIKLGIATGVLLSPLLPVVDGDSFKSIYRNRNVAKFITGIGAASSLFIISNILIDKYSNSKDSKTTCKTLSGGLLAILLLLANQWSKTDKNKLSAKCYGIAAILGAAIMYAKTLINSSKNMIC